MFFPRHKPKIELNIPSVLLLVSLHILCAMLAVGAKILQQELNDFHSLIQRQGL